MTPYFRIDNLKVNFETYEGVKSVLDIERIILQKGETFGLVGESGVGKTVLAHTILGLLSRPPGSIESGTIMFNGDDLLLKTEAEMQKIRGKKISMIFQDPMSTLNPVFTVGSQITRVIRQNQGVNQRECERTALEKLELVKLPDAKEIMKKYPHELSGGQRQRVIIAIALSCGAELLIADEPTRNLDVTIQAGILKLIAKLQKELNMTVLFIANNLGLISATCDDLAILYKGKIIEMGTVNEVLHDSCHPYTKALIMAVPRDKRIKMDWDHVIPKTDKHIDSHGCPYFDLCSLDKIERCRKNVPTLKTVKGTHAVACHLIG